MSLDPKFMSSFGSQFGEAVVAYCDPADHKMYIKFDAETAIPVNTGTIASPVYLTFTGTSPDRDVTIFEDVIDQFYLVYQDNALATITLRSKDRGATWVIWTTQASGATVVTGTPDVAGVNTATIVVVNTPPVTGIQYATE